MNTNNRSVPLDPPVPMNSDSSAHHDPKRPWSRPRIGLLAAEETSTESAKDVNPSEFPTAAGPAAS